MKSSYLKPKLFSVIKNYNKDQFVKDVIAGVIVAIIAFIIALNPKSSIMALVADAWAGFGSAFGPVVLFALFWKRTTKWGAFAGMLSGGAMVFIWKFVIRTSFAGTWLDIYELLPAFILACIVIVAVSLLTKAPEKDITDVYDELKAVKVN